MGMRRNRRGDRAEPPALWPVERTARLVAQTHSYQITSLTRTRWAIVVLGVEPMRANHGEHYVALRNLDVELLDEVHTGLHGIDIHEQVAAREVNCEVIEQPPRDARRVVATVVDENPRNGCD